MNYQEIDGWFDFEDIYDKAVESANDNDFFVEIGVYKGKSTCYMAQKIKNSGKKILFFAVDTFEMGTEDEASENIIKCGLEGYAILVKSVGHTLAESFPDKSVAFIFIDGSHEYDYVVKDIQAWLPKLKPTGVMAGHDYEYVRKAVNDTLGNVAQSKSSWIKE